MNKKTNGQAEYSDPKVQRRANAIEEVKRAICVDRNASHGDAEDNFWNIAQTWTMILNTRGLIPNGRFLTSLDVSAMMTAFKVCRYASNPKHRDHLLDAAGYALCGVGISDSLPHIRPDS